MIDNFLNLIDAFFNWVDRCYWRWMNSDPVRNCPVFKEGECNLVDGPCCNFPNCDMYLNKMGKDFMSCANCDLNGLCSSKNYGLGCYVIKAKLKTKTNDERN